MPLKSENRYTHFFYNKLLYKNPLNFIANYNRNTIDFSSHYNTEQKKTKETFSTKLYLSFL